MIPNHPDLPLRGERVLAAVAREADSDWNSFLTKGKARPAVDGIAEHRRVPDAKDDVVRRVDRHPFAGLEKTGDERPAIHDSLNPALATREDLDAQSDARRGDRVQRIGPGVRSHRGGVGARR